MRRQAIFLLIFAVAAGGLAAFLATQMLRVPAQTADTPATSTSSVAVAARDMNVGTLLQPSDIRLVDWPSGQIPAGYSTSVDEVVGRGLLTPVRMNEPLLSTKLASIDAGGGMQIMIPDGKRAMAVRVDDVVGVAGFVLPGSRVDVLVTMDRAASQNEAATRLILQNLEVVSAGQSIERTPDGDPQSVSVVTLVVDPEQAERLALAHSDGRLQLALRHPLDMDSVATTGITASQMIAATRPQPQPVASAPRPAAAPAPAASSGLQLEIYRGPQRTTSDVEATLEGSAGSAGGGL